MKKYIIPVLMLLGLLVSCTEENSQVQDQTVPISFTMKGVAPIMVYPGEKVSYSFEIEYDKGLSEVFCRVGKTELEGSRQSYENAPAKVEYGFEYVPADTQAGTTVDFVVEAVGADGLSRTTDIPLYVRATKADIVITIPDEAPSEFLVGSALEFTVRVTSGIDIKHICLYKNEQLVEGSLMETFEDPKSIDYLFSYEPGFADVGSPVVFKFEVMDTRGNIVTRNYSVTFTKPVSTEVDEWSGIMMGYQKNTAYGQYLSSTTGNVYKMSEGGENCADIDIVIYFSGNTTTKGLGITSPTSTNSSSMYGNQTTINNAGGDAADNITAWGTRNTVTFKLVGGNIKDAFSEELDDEGYGAVSTKQALIDLWNNSASGEIVTALMVQPGAIFSFKNEDGRYGLLRVVARDGANTGTVTFDLKIEK